MSLTMWFHVVDDVFPCPTMSLIMWFHVVDDVIPCRTMSYDVQGWLNVTRNMTPCRKMSSTSHTHQCNLERESP
eukprot:12423240-Karenia_brevis.AAC.1